MLFHSTHTHTHTDIRTHSPHTHSLLKHTLSAHTLQSARLRTMGNETELRTSCRTNERSLYKEKKEWGGGGEGDEVG